MSGYSGGGFGIVVQQGPHPANAGIEGRIPAGTRTWPEAFEQLRAWHDPFAMVNQVNQHLDNLGRCIKRDVAPERLQQDRVEPDIVKAKHRAYPRVTR